MLARGNLLSGSYPRYSSPAHMPLQFRSPSEISASPILAWIAVRPWNSPLVDSAKSIVTPPYGRSASLALELLPASSRRPDWFRPLSARFWRLRTERPRPGPMLLEDLFPFLPALSFPFARRPAFASNSHEGLVAEALHDARYGPAAYARRFRSSSATAAGMCVVSGFAFRP